GYLAADLERLVRVASAEFRQCGRQQRAAEVARNTDAQRDRGAADRGKLDDLVVDRQEAPRAVGDGAPPLGRNDARGALVEQFAAQEALEPLDLGAHRRLGAAQ